jgi:deoxyhypusine synthase
MLVSFLKHMLLMLCSLILILGDFHLPGNELRKKGLNRAGNLLIPNSNYCAFENWLTPILEQMSKEQSGVGWTPSKVSFYCATV